MNGFYVILISCGSNEIKYTVKDELGDILKKTEVGFVSLSCIVQTLWDITTYN